MIRCLIGRRARPATPVAPFGAVLVSVLLLATGCADSPEGNVRSGDAAPPGSGVVSPVPGERERPVTWRLVRPMAGPAVLVEVQIGGAPCDVVTGVDVTETDRAVELTVWAGREPGATCDGVPATVGTYQLRVPLESPLGGRTLQ